MQGWRWRAQGAFVSRVALLVASGCCDKRTGKSVVSGQSLIETESDFFRKRKREIAGRLHVCASVDVSEPWSSWKAAERSAASQAPPSPPQLRIFF